MKQKKTAFWKTIQALLIISILALNSCGATTGNINKKDKSLALRKMGFSLFQQGKAREGLATLLKAEKIDPSNPDLQQEIALVYQDIDEYDLALNHFKKAIQLKPDFSEAYNNLGVLYSEKGKFKEALESFDKAVSNILYTTPHFAYHNMGLVYYRIKDNKKAIDYYNKAIEQAPYYVDAYIDLGIVYENTGKYEDAILINKKVMHLIPESMETHLNIAKIYLKAGHDKKAVEELQSIISTDPRHPAARKAMEMLEEIK
ncbi:tetratricopeptide repeat protein [Thermodesulfobacteriota bacterium]